MVLVLRCGDIDETRRFYESHDLVFSRERHGAGPEHYWCVQGDFVIELYPAEDVDGRRAGDTTLRLAATRSETVRDPDGRWVQIAREAE